MTLEEALAALANAEGELAQARLVASFGRLGVATGKLPDVIQHYYDSFAAGESALTARAEKAEAACAEMRTAVEKLHDLLPMNGPEERWAIQQAQRLAAPIVKRALSADVGKGFASPEQVQVIAEESWSAGQMFGVDPESYGVASDAPTTCEIAKVLKP